MTEQPQRRPIGRTALSVTELGLGSTPLGGMYRAVDVTEAVATVHAAFEAGIRYIDSAPLYDFGLSETRLGQAIAALPHA